MVKEVLALTVFTKVIINKKVLSFTASMNVEKSFGLKDSIENCVVLLIVLKKAGQTSEYSRRNTFGFSIGVKLVIRVIFF